MGKSKGQMKSRLSYSAGAFGNDVFYATLSTYFIMFVTTHLFNTGDPKQNSHYVLLITNINTCGKECIKEPDCTIELISKEHEMAQLRSSNRLNIYFTT